MVKKRIKFWAVAIVLGFVLVWGGNCYAKRNVERSTITVNAPQAMQEAFIKTLKMTKLNEKYEIKFTDSEDANFTVTTQKGKNGQLIAYSPIIAVFNPDEELYQSYIDNGVFIQSETEYGAYDFDFEKIMDDIIKNPNSNYKIYYPDSSIGDKNTFYDFLLYTANGGSYPKIGINMAETKEKVNTFLQCKNVETISESTIDKIGGFSKNSIYFISLADLGYVYEEKGINCKVMYPKTVLYYNYYANFDETGKILYDALEQESGSFLTNYTENTGYYCLIVYGNYFVEGYKPIVTIYNGNISRSNLELRDTFNAVETPLQTTVNTYEED